MAIRRVLSVDGGGIRGILPATLLSTVEERLGKPCSALFDLVSGTSTGGIIAAGVFSGRTAGAISQLYVDHGGAIFNRTPWSKIASGFGVWGPKYNPEELEFRLEQVLGYRRLSCRLLSGPEIIVPTYCIRLPYPMDIDRDGVKECASALLFRSWSARQDKAFDFNMTDVCRATSAAPTYFSAAHIKSYTGAEYTCVDGGVYANNPAVIALDAAQSLWPTDEIRVVSLGTGSAVKAIPGYGKFGLLQWAPHIMGPAMDGASDSIGYDIKNRLGDKCVRVEIALEGVNEAFDDASPKNIKALQTLAQKYTNAGIDAVVKTLT